MKTTPLTIDNIITIAVDCCGTEPTARYEDLEKAIKRYSTSLIQQAKEEEREKIIEDYGHFTDGCGCCSEKTLYGVLQKDITTNK